ncbi:MAG TPA: hypothetical protein VLC09_03035 [Polyangiaceae bacterium]|nr:hypothetical protein [Polyangiaceae bacterium]
MTGPHSELARLDDYLSGVMTEAERDDFEELLFDADATLQAEIAFLDRLVRFTQHITKLGMLHPSLTAEELAEMRAAGRRVDLRDLGVPGTVVAQPPEPGAEVVVQRAELRLFDVESVDLEIVLPELGHVKTLRDLKVDPTDGAVYACCDATLFRMALEQSPRTIFRVVAMRGGRRENLGEYELVVPG